MRQFSIYQGRWSAAARDFVREIIPMALSERYGARAMGSPWWWKLQDKRAAGSGEGQDKFVKIALSGKDEKVSALLEETADKKERSLRASRWQMSRTSESLIIWHETDQLIA